MILQDSNVFAFMLGLIIGVMGFVILDWILASTVTKRDKEVIN